MEAHGIPRNLLNEMGASPVGCFPCINSRKAEIRAIATIRPERIDFLERMEAYVGDGNFGISTFFPRGYIPLRLNSKAVEIRGTGYTVPTIRDVVAWSHTSWSGHQQMMEFDDMLAGSACAVRGYV